MAIGLSIHVGLNSVDPDHYQGWAGELIACEADAADMQDLAKKCGFDSRTMLTKAASRRSLIGALEDAADRLGNGDMFLLSFSGHGGQIEDTNGDDADDGLDETWCLFDGEIIDDELYYLLSKFKNGVRVLVFSDSCHSGTVTKDKILKRRRDLTEARYRAMPISVARATYEANREFYDRIQSDKRLTDSRSKIVAPTLLISGCQGNQLSADGEKNGYFTESLLRIRNGGLFEGNYDDFYRAVRNAMNPDQTPNMFWAHGVDEEFLSQTPFSITEKEKSEVKSMIRRIFTIYTSPSDTWETLVESSGLTRDDLISLNPHIATLEAFSPGIPIDVPEAMKRERAKAQLRFRSKKTPYQVARDELLKGVAEYPGHADNPRIVLYHSTTSGGAAPDEVPWCSSFVNFCVEQAGMVGTDSKAARSWHNNSWGRSVPSSEWQEGDIVVFWRGDKQGSIGHVGFLVDWQGSAPEVLGGNQGNRVSIQTPYPFSHILSVRRAN